MRKPLIAANWKMHKTVEEAKAFMASLEARGILDSVDILLFPPFTALYALANAIDDTRLHLGAQNMFYKKKGAYTGEISPIMILELCSYVLIGHSERRQHFHETDETVRLKLGLAAEQGLNSILCIGETLQERQEGITEPVIERQLRAALNGLEDISRITIAYEPVWAIGTKKAATPKQAQEVHRFIRELISDMFGEQAAAVTRILYGGSMNPHNALELLAQEDIDGGLLGGAGLDPVTFSKVIAIAATIKN